MGQDSDCSTFAPEGRGRDSHSNCSMPVVPSLNLIPDGDGGDSNVDHNNDDKEDGDDDFFFPWHCQIGLPFEECQINQEGKEFIVFA